MLELQTGTVLQNRYQVVSLIGKGGMGAVYESIDQRLKNKVALKQTLVNEPKLRKAFEHEAQILASLRHPAMTKVIDHFTDENGQFLVMEFIPGNDLGQMLADQNKPFPLDEVLDWTEHLLDALDYIHTQEIPIIHRDIKPQNLKLTPRGEIIMLDFGLAKGSASLQSRVTSDGSVFGYTPKYAPLEQIQGTGTDPRSDLYSLAATVYHLLTYTPPTDALARAAAVLNNQSDPLKPPDTINPNIPPLISQLLMDTLSLGADKRPSSATDMLEALRAMRQQAATGTSSHYDTIVIPSKATPPKSQYIQEDIPDPQGGGQQSSSYTGQTIASVPAQTRPPDFPIPPATDNAAQQQKRNWKKFCLWTSGILGVVVLLLCGSLAFLANIGRKVQEENANATATAEALDYEANGVMYATETAESSTAFIQAIDTAESWQPVMFDTFDDNQHDWADGEQEDGSFTFENGTYVWDVFEADEDFWWRSSPDMEDVGDFSITVDGRLLDGMTRHSRYGIAYSNNADRNFYMFCIRDDKQFQLLLQEGEYYDPIIDWTKHDAITPGYFNELRVIVIGADHFLFINGEQVAHVEDATIQKGSVGLVVGIDEDEEATFAFDNFDLYAPTLPVATETPFGDTPKGDPAINPPMTSDMLIFDSFDDNSSGWTIGEKENEWWRGNKYLTDFGTYRWEMEGVQSFVHHDEPEMPEITDFTLNVMAQRIEGPEATSIYGVVFRQQAESDSFYEFKIADDQTFKVSLSQGPDWTTLIDWSDATAIQPGAMNMITVEAQGGYFSFWINGEKVGEIEDYTLIQGKVGLVAELDEGEKAIFEFDDFDLNVGVPPKK